MIAASSIVHSAAVLIGIVGVAGCLLAALARIEPLLPPESGSVCARAALSAIVMTVVP